MKSRYFVFKEKSANDKIIAEFTEAAKERDGELTKLREEFGLVGFVYGSQGVPDYFLKDLGDSVDTERFKVGRINRAGNDLATLEPIDVEVLNRCANCAITTLIDVVSSHLPFRPQIHIHTEPSPKAQQAGNFVLVEVVEYDDVPFSMPTNLVEISQDEYTNPNLDNLGKLVS